MFTVVLQSYKSQTPDMHFEPGLKHLLSISTSHSPIVKHQPCLYVCFMMITVEVDGRSLSPGLCDVEVEGRCFRRQVFLNQCNANNTSFYLHMISDILCSKYNNFLPSALSTSSEQFLFTIQISQALREIHIRI